MKMTQKIVNQHQVEDWSSGSLVAASIESIWQQLASPVHALLRFVAYLFCHNIVIFTQNNKTIISQKYLRYQLYITSILYGDSETKFLLEHLSSLDSLLMLPFQQTLSISAYETSSLIRIFEALKTKFLVSSFLVVYGSDMDDRFFCQLLQLKQTGLK